MTRTEQMQMIEEHDEWMRAIHHPLLSVFEAYQERYPFESPTGQRVSRFLLFQDLNEGMRRRDH